MKLCIILGLTLIEVYSKCAYRVLDDGKPEKVNFDAYEVHDLTQCV